MKKFLVVLVATYISNPAFAAQNCNLTESQQKEAHAAAGQFLYNTIKPNLFQNGISVQLPSKADLSFTIDGDILALTFTVDSGSPLRAWIERFQTYADGYNERSNIRISPAYDAAGNYVKCEVIFASHTYIYSVNNVETGKNLNINKIAVPEDSFYTFGPNN